jgi:hypothetical protein
MTSQGLSFDSTVVGTPIIEQFGEAIIKDGFKPHLPQIVEEVKRKWRRHHWVPLTILTRMSDGVDNWQPSEVLYRTKMHHAVVLALIQRDLWACGGTEALYIMEAWEKDQDDPAKRTGGEVLIIQWECRYENLTYMIDICQGRNSKYLSTTHNTIDLVSYNPALKPWNTNEDLIEYCGVAPEDQARFIAMIEHVERGIRQRREESQSERISGVV